MSFSTSLVRFVLKLCNVLLLLLGISMGLYALSTFEQYKKLKHGDDGNATLVEFPHLDIPLGHSHLDFNLNSTKVPVYITGLGGAGVFTTITAATGLYAADSGRALCLNLYSLELLVMVIFQVSVIGLIYTHRIYIPEDQKKSAEGSKLAKFLLKQEKISKVLALAILCLQVLCIFAACVLKGMKYTPRDEFDFDDFDPVPNRPTQPLLHFSDPDRGSPSSRKKKDRKRKTKKGKKSAAIMDKYYDDV